MSITLYETEIYALLYDLTRFNKIDQVLKEVVELAKQSIQAEFSSLYLLENGIITHHLLNSASDFPEVARYKIQKSMKEGLAGWVYRHKQGALASDVTIDERWSSIDNNNPFGSVVIVPLIIHDKIIAILTLGHSEKRFFREFHLAKAAIFAEQAAIIVENSRLAERNKLLENSIETLFNSVKQPFIVIDKNEIRYCNQAAEDKLSLSKVNSVLSESINGNKIHQLLEENINSNIDSFDIELTEGQVYNILTNPISNVGLGLLFSEV